MPHILRDGNSLTVSGRSWWSGKSIKLEVCNGIVKSIQESGTEDDFILAPVFFDSQVNGYAGVDFSDANLTFEEMKRAIDVLRKHGVRAFLPTIVTNTWETLLGSLDRLSQMMNSFPEIRGIHLEGPYISPEDGPRGAHRKDLIRTPSIAEFDELFAASRESIRLLTLAPELPGAAELIKHAVSCGVIVGIGHTAASEEDIGRAVEAGARWSTHLGNGAHSRIRRHPNYIWSQLASDQLTASIIADGFHLPPSVVKTFWRCKGPNRITLTTDAVYLSGMQPGDYEFVGQQVTLTSCGKVVLKGTDYLAGAVRPLTENIQNLVSFSDATLEEAIGAASVIPAEVLLPHCHFSEPAVGEKAQFNLLHWDGKALQVVASVFDSSVILSKDVE